MPLSAVDRFAELVEADSQQPRQRRDTPGHPGRRHAEVRGTTHADLLALVGSLRELDFAVAPSEATRQRQRARLVAMAAVRTPDPTDAGRHRAVHPGEESDPDGVWSSLVARLQQFRSGRRLIAGVAGLSVIVAAMGILALLAQSAIPGDTLYAFKHGTEQARLALAGTEQAEGRALLGFASTRMEEIVALLDEPVAIGASGSGVQAAAAGTVSSLLVTTLDTMDRQTADGTSALTTAAVEEGSLPTLQFVGEWGVAQFGTLDEMAERMPQAARDRAGDSKQLLQRVVARLELLAWAIDCDTPGSGSTDDLGPLPPSTCSSPRGGSPSAAGPTGGSAGRSPTSSPPTSAASETARTTTQAPTSSAPGVEPPAAPGPDPDPSPSPNPSPSGPLPIPIPIPIPIPTQSSGPGEPAPDPIPDPNPDPNEGEPCTLIGFLGIEIPGIMIGGICVGLGG